MKTKYVNYICAAVKQECEKKGSNVLTSRQIRKLVDLGGLYTLIEHGYLKSGDYNDNGELTYIFKERGWKK